MDGSIELITIILGIDNSGRTILERYVRIELFERTLLSPLNLTQDKGEAGACHCKTKRSSKGGRRNRERERRELSDAPVYAPTALGRVTCQACRARQDGAVRGAT